MRATGRINSKSESENMNTIVVIDDVIGVRKSIAGILSRAGYTVHEATSGAEGVDLARRVHPDLVITDILMPGQDGLETIAQIKSACGAKQPKFLAVSGGGSLLPSEQALTYAAKAADDVLAKPFDRSDLLSKITELMEANNAAA